jgi:repressor LexA
MSKELTTRQRQVLDYISDYICERGYPPTIREIGDHMGIKSTNGVSEHLETLWRKGYLIRDEERSNLARAMRLKHLPTVPVGALQIPLLGEVTAGAPRLAIQEAEENLFFDRQLVGDNRDLFALRIDGESMIERGIFDGDIVFVKRTNQAQDGDVVIALIEDEATCKTFYREGKKIRLQPENSTMDPIYVSRSMFRETMILGIVIGVYRSL